MKKHFSKLFIFSALGLIALPLLAHAQILPACTATGNCGICDILDTAMRIFKYLLGITGGAVLLLFIWHAFGFLTAMGNAEKVQSSGKALMHTFIGLLLILASWILVNMVLFMLFYSSSEQRPNGNARVAMGAIFSASGPAWYEYCTGNVPGSTLSKNEQLCQGRGIGSPCGNGQYCQYVVDSTGKPVTPLKFTCMYGTNGQTACAYWASSPNQGGGARTEYAGYKCTTPSNCTSGKDLGTEYCQNTSTTNKTCCFPVDSNK